MPNAAGWLHMVGPATVGSTGLTGSGSALAGDAPARLPALAAVFCLARLAAGRGEGRVEALLAQGFLQSTSLCWQGKGQGIGQGTHRATAPAGTGTVTGFVLKSLARKEHSLV